MPNPSKFFSDPESGQESNVGPKGWGTLEEKVTPKGEGFADEEGADPQSGSGTTKTGREEPINPKGKS